MADEHLMRSGLHYSIVRPGTLTNDAAKGKFIITRPAQKEDAIITRDDVAKALLFIVNNSRKANTVTELFNGSKSIDEVMK